MRKRLSVLFPLAVVANEGPKYCLSDDDDDNDDDDDHIMIIGIDAD